MTTKSDFQRLFRPRAVAIVGASGNAARIGGQPLRSLTQFGYAGGVYPVNPKYKTLNDIVCYSRIAEIPRPCDVAIIALPAPLVPDAIEECGAAGISFAIVFSAGFREVGEEGAALQDKLVAAANRSGVRVIGPNCQGVLNLLTRFYGGFGSIFQKADLQGGPLAMITQSGGFGTSVVKLAQSAGLGFNYVVSTGNEADVDALDLIEFFLGQDDVEVVATYMEGIRDGRRLLALGERALDLGKPILVWKVGNSGSGRRAALSHTANLTSGAELYRAVFQQGGFIEVRDVDDLMDTARALLSRRLPRGRNVAVVTNSGGAGVLLADRCEERGLHLPALAESAIPELRELIPDYGSLANPVDVTAQVSSDPLRMNRVVSVLLGDPGVDQIIISRGSVVGKPGLAWAQEFVKVAQGTDKPILVHMSPDQAEETVQVLDRHRLPWYATPGRAVTGAAALYEFAVKKKRRTMRVQRTLPRHEIAWPPGAGPLGEHMSKRALAVYGIPAVRETLLSLDAIDGLASSPLPFPLAVKVESADIPHKTEVGAVRLGINDLAQLKEAASAIVASARAHHPAARIDGVLVQEMATGVEMILGLVNDPYFGPVVALGLGGIFTEILRDVTHRCAPVDVPTAHAMIGELKGRAILDGVRGGPASDIDALADTVSRLSLLAADHADRIAEIDINPLFVRAAGKGVAAADALVVLRNAHTAVS